MSRSRASGGGARPSGIDGALEVLDARELRDLLRDLLRELDVDTQGRVIDRLVARAARRGTGWVPKGPDEQAVAEALSFAMAAARDHYADPRAVDRFLRRGTDAFLRKDYEAARRIFHALLPPIAGADIDLGQDEMADEVLTVDAGQCAARYAVSTFMTADPERRPAAVHAAIRAAGDLGLFREPIAEMEGVAVEPLPGLDEFLPRWRDLVEKEAARGATRSGWDSDEDRWLREVVRRLEGADGLAAHARATRRGPARLVPSARRGKGVEVRPRCVRGGRRSRARRIALARPVPGRRRAGRAGARASGPAISPRTCVARGAEPAAAPPLARCGADRRAGPEPRGGRPGGVPEA
jgi:hypothetical protein